MRWQRYLIEIEESIITVLSKKICIEKCQESIINTRKIINEFIMEFPDFLTTHKPLSISDQSSPIIKKMCSESKKVGVGPMATVAGIVAVECLKTVLTCGNNETIVDNGGDMAIFLQKPITVGIFSGINSPHNLAFKIGPRKNPFGICTSSGIVGHSFSYGKAGAAIIISENIILADAAATAVANRVKSMNDLNHCFNILHDLSEIEGGLVTFNNKISLWGKLPKIIQAKVDMNLITMGH